MAEKIRMSYREACTYVLEAIEEFSQEECKKLLNEVIIKVLKGNENSDITITIGTGEEPKQLLEEKDILKILNYLGIPTHIKGHSYLKVAIQYYSEYKNKNGTGCGMTTELYPYVARTFNTTACRAERAMRHAVETAWDRGNPEVQEEVFGYTINSLRGKPTNSEFIAMITEHLAINK